MKVRYPDLADLTVWAVEDRYPGDWPDATAGDARHAVEQARGVFESVAKDLREHGFQVEDPEQDDGAEKS